jgi:small-conductance mechanosensitive channel
MGGAIFFGIGIGLQKIVLNLISGIILLLEDVIKENDVIELENGVTGSVKFISARYILIKTFAGKEMLIPNEEFIVKKVINWTLSDNKVRLDIKIPVSYHEDLEKIQKLTLEAISNYKHLDKIKEPHCYLSKFDDSAVIFILRFWVDNIIIERTQKPKSDIMFLIWKKFKQHNITMPFPQRDINLKF